MDKSQIDLSALPEPWRSMLQNLDVEAIKQLQTSMDPAMMEGLVKTALGMARNTMRPEDVQVLEEMVGSLLKVMASGK